jgi:tetratricopeptide (TPR) repeat protein
LEITGRILIWDVFIYGDETKMLKIKATVLFIIFIPLFLRSAEAEVITLKSGKVFNGEIVERAKDYIRVKYNGFEIYYENKYIKSIESQQSDMPIAITQKEKAVEKVSSFLNKGIDLALAGNFDEARQEFKKQLNDAKGGLDILDAVEKGVISKEYATYLFQGSWHIIKEEYNLAIASLEKAWEINPKDPDVNFNLGFCHYSLGEYDKTIAYLYAALKLQPDDTEAYELIARTYYNLGEYQKARENLLMDRELLKKNGDENGVAYITKLLETVATVIP